MSKKKDIKTPKSKIIDGADATVLINIFTPGHEPKDFKINLPNICGEANLLHRSPESMLEAIINGLRAKYGNRVS